MVLRLERKTIIAERICSLELVDPHARPLPRFSAGAHLDLQVADGVVRQYSLSNDPTEDQRYRLAVLKEEDSSGGSVAVHDQLQEGDLVLVSAPRNHFRLANEARHSLLFAGGIGITPILSMAWSLQGRGAAFDLHYSARSEARTAFRDEIRSAPFADRTRFYFSDGAPRQRFRDQLPQLIPEPADHTHVYVCGPRGFIEAVMDSFESRGWPKQQLHTEYFEGAEFDTSDDDSFEVELASSGDVYTVPPDRSVFEVLDEAGIFIPTSCEQGVCGTCLTKVLEGEPEHRDMFMDDDEHATNDQFTPCCSRSKSKRLVLDL
ncbi:oxidoreductase [Natronospirillum operosum]|uniref:Oxidoreductase n=2 Tax=Natronospirillum operosum TaxID=2759953 RepID=A0A4Z0W887_9GAMM|nr:oxidoreductase [Natronospirillum operosum]